jgi:hypothetical protein
MDLTCCYLFLSETAIECFGGFVVTNGSVASVLIRCAPTWSNGRKVFPIMPTTSAMRGVVSRSSVILQIFLFSYFFVAEPEVHHSFLYKNPSIPELNKDEQECDKVYAAFDPGTVIYLYLQDLFKPKSYSCRHTGCSRDQHECRHR